MRFEVGDRVFLNPESEFATGEGVNPLGVLGEVTEVYSPYSLPIKVRWNNDTINSYSDKDLLPATKLAKAIYGEEENERI